MRRRRTWVWALLLLLSLSSNINATSGQEVATAEASLDDTCTFAGGRWTTRQAATRPAAFVPAPVNGVVLFGGQQDGRSVLCDMFVWAGSDWRQVTMPNDRPCLHSHSMAYDVPSGKRVFFGGSDSSGNGTIALDDLTIGD